MPETMTKPNGLYGYIRQNEFRSLAMFAGFAVAFQIIGAAILTVPLMFTDPTHQLLNNPVGYAFKYGLIIFMIQLVLFMVQFLAVTGTIQSSTDFQYVTTFDQPRLSSIVEVLAMTAGIPKPRIAIIRSDARNAFACGTGTSSAVIVVTTGLLEVLNDDELSAVIAHEIVHIRNGDIVLMASANILFENVRMASSFMALKRKRYFLIFILFPPLLLMALSMVLLQKNVVKFGQLIGDFCRMMITSSRELIADAESIRLTHNPAALISALRKLEGKSDLGISNEMIDAMMIDGVADGLEATHPTISQRIDALMQITGSMAATGLSSKDTRPIADIVKHRQGVFGRKGARAHTANAFAIDRQMAVCAEPVRKNRDLEQSRKKIIAVVMAAVLLGIGVAYPQSYILLFILLLIGAGVYEYQKDGKDEDGS